MNQLTQFSQKVALFLLISFFVGIKTWASCTRVDVEEWYKQTQFETDSTPEILDKVIALADAKPRFGKKKKAIIFDIDETLIVTTGRVFIGMQLWANSSEAEAYHVFRNAVLRINREKMDYDDRITLERVGIDISSPEHQEAYQKFNRFWTNHYFSNDGISNFEPPLRGAIDFLKRVALTDTEIYLITGRDEETMLEGTIRQMAFHGIDVKQSNIHLKLRKKVNGEKVYASVFKQGEFKKVHEEHDVLAVLDNDIWNLEAADAVFNPKTTMIIFVDTYFPRDKFEPLQFIYRIPDGIYRRN